MLRVLIYEMGLLVQMMPLDVFKHGFGKVITKWLAISSSLAYLARGDLKEWSFHIMDLGAYPG